MAVTKHWTVDLYIGEHENGVTYAEARLITHATDGLRAVGKARLNPHDANVPEVGDEIAAARALRVLADDLLDVAAGDVEDLTHQPVHLKSR